MKIIELLEAEAIRRGLLTPGESLDADKVFKLVRDMPYRRASDRQPETIIRQWQGTCSGKHYLLQALFAELGFESQVMACTTITPVAEDKIPLDLRPLYESANRRFVDVHNYLVVYGPGETRTIVDATFPLSARQAGLVSNDSFVPGRDQQLASKPLQSWEIPPGREPQAFKDELLHEYFTPAELELREIIIRALGDKA
jgi:hypothetical protein